MGNQLFVILAVLDLSFAVNWCLNHSFFLNLLYPSTDLAYIRVVAYFVDLCQVASDYDEGFETFHDISSNFVRKFSQSSSVLVNQKLRKRYRYGERRSASL